MHATDSDVADSHRWSALLQALVWCTAHQHERNSSTADASLQCAATPAVSLEVLSELTRVFNLRAKTPVEHQGDAPRAQLLRWLAQAAGAMLLHSNASAAAAQLSGTGGSTDDTVVADNDDSSSTSSSSDAVTASTASAGADSAGVCTAQHLKAAQYLQRAGLCDALDTAAVAQCLADRLLVNIHNSADAAAATAAAATAGAAAAATAAVEALQHKQRYSSAQLAGMCAATIAADSTAVGRQLVRALLSSSADSNATSTVVAVAARAEAVKWIIKLRLTDDREFVPVLLQNSTSSSCSYSTSSTLSAAGATAANSGAQSLLPVLTLLPSSELAVVIVCDAASLALARNILLPPQHSSSGGQTKPVVVGIDTEWRPFSTGQQRTRVSLVQVACSTHAFLFDLMSLEHGWSLTTDTASNSSNSSTSCTITETSDVHMQQQENSSSDVVKELYRELMQELLTSERVTKLAYGFDNDHR
jgi:hypothetical protein